jgi:cell division protein FtsB
MNWPTSIWSRLQSLGFVVFTGIVAVGVALMFLPLLNQRRAMQAEAQRLDREIARLESIEKKQKTEIEALKTDPAFVERTARDKLNLVRPNETIFRFEPVPAPKRGLDAP